MHLNIGSQVVAVWKELGSVALLEEVYHWGRL